nr:DUF6880 family protein [Sphingomonas bacterium]
MAANAPTRAVSGERRVVGLSTRGPIYQDDYERGRHGRLVRSALTEIADALGDVDGFAGRYSDVERANPAIAAAIAERLLAADRASRWRHRLFPHGGWEGRGLADRLHSI